MNEKSRKILEDTGWYEGRKIGIEEIVKIYKYNGKKVFPKAKEFLEQFGDIEVKVSTFFRHCLNLKRLFSNRFYEGIAPEISIALGQQVLFVGTCSGYDIYIYIRRWQDI